MRVKGRHEIHEMSEKVQNLYNILEDMVKNNLKTVRVMMDVGKTVDDLEKRISVLEESRRN